MLYKPLSRAIVCVWVMDMLHFASMRGPSPESMHLLRISSGRRLRARNTEKSKLFVGQEPDDVVRLVEIDRFGVIVGETTFYASGVDLANVEQIYLGSRPALL